MLKNLSLAGLRVATALLLVMWGLVRLSKPEIGAHVSAKYYGGVGAMSWVQTGWGLALLTIGLLVALGLFRKVSLPAQAVVLVTGALSIWKYLLDPLGVWLLAREDAQLLFFPSLAMAFGSLLLVAMRNEDQWSLDSWLMRRRKKQTPLG